MALSGGVDSTALLHLLIDALHESGSDRGAGRDSEVSARGSIARSIESKPTRTETVDEVSRAGTQGVVAYTVDHGLRPDSSAEAAQVAALCKKLGVQHRVLDIGAQMQGWLADRHKLARHDPHCSNARNMAKGGVETKARALRYTALTTACLSDDCTALFVAHHEDDALETLLMRLAKLKTADNSTSTSDSRGGYRDDDRNDGQCRSLDLQRPTHFAQPLPVSPNPLGQALYDGWRIQIHRPLLGLSKQDLVQYCRARGIRWFEDATNADASLTPRNAVRHILRQAGDGQVALPAALSRNRLLALRQRYQAAHQELAAFERGVLRGIDLQIDRATASIDFDCRRLLSATSGDEALRVFVLERLAQLVSPSERIDRDSLLGAAAKLTITADAVKTTAAGLLWHYDPASQRCKVYRQPFMRGENVVVDNLSTSWVLWDRRLWLRLAKQPVSITSKYRVRSLSKLDLKRAIDAGRDAERHEAGTRRVKTVASASVRHTLPVVVAAKVNGMEKLIAIPTLDIVLDDQVQFEWQWAGESLLRRFRRNAAE